MKEYPEHEKLSKIEDKSQTIGEFIEWAEGKGIHLAMYRETMNDNYVDPKTFEVVDEYTRGDQLNKKVVHNPEYCPAGNYFINKPIQDLLAEFFGVDQGKLEKEKRRMLKVCRELNKTL